MRVPTLRQSEQRGHLSTPLGFASLRAGFAGLT